MRDNIQRLEDEMLKHEQVEIETTHYFCDGMYARSILIPKGVTLTGKIHKTEHMNVISKGDITVRTEDGEKRLKAGDLVISKPGTKRAGYAHEDTIWTTFHATSETNIEKLEALLVVDTHEELEYSKTKIEGEK